MLIVIELCIVLGVILLDMLSKAFAQMYLTTLPGNSLTVIEGVFNFTYTTNDGAAWSILSGQRWLFVVMGVIACIIMVWFLWKSKQTSKILRIGLSLMLGGTIGNMYDRIVLGEVRDMLHVTFIRFPIFNIADCALCIGVALVIVYILFIYKEPDKKDSNTPKSEENKTEDTVEVDNG